MSASNVLNKTSFRRAMLLASLVLLSTLLPFGLACWSIRSAIWGKPNGRPSHERKYFQGFVKGGQFWYLVGSYPGHGQSSRITWHIRRLDLKTGIERNTDLELGSQFQTPFLVNGEIYGKGDGISKVVGNRFVKVADWPVAAFQDGRLYSYLFVDDGQLSMIAETNEGEYSLLRLVGDRWMHGRKIRLPPVDSEWELDDQQKYVIQKTKVFFRKAKGQNSIWVSKDGDSAHIFVTYANGFAAYRNGFDFVEDDSAPESAIEPANDSEALRRITGWEPIQPTDRRDRWHGMQRDSGGVWIYGGFSDRVVRRTNSGEWIHLSGMTRINFRGVYRRIIVDSETDEVYALDSNEFWNSLTAYSIVENQAVNRRVLLRGAYDEYLGRWQFYLVEIALAWLLHLTLLTCCVEWFASGFKSTTCLIGDRLVTLAPIPRRVMACVADVIFFSLIFVVLLRLQMWAVDFGFPGYEAFCRMIFEYEDSVYNFGVKSRYREFLVNDVIKQMGTWNYWTSLSEVISDYDRLLMLAIVDVLALIVLRSYFEGRYTLTPGKWLFGLRTVRTSAQPCGFSRAFIRNLLCWIDFPFFITPIPTNISAAWSERRQRICDRLADTIVVTRNSIRKR